MELTIGPSPKSPPRSPFSPPRSPSPAACTHSVPVCARYARGPACGARRQGGGGTDKALIGASRLSRACPELVEGDPGEVSWNVMMCHVLSCGAASASSSSSRSLRRCCLSHHALYSGASLAASAAGAGRRGQLRSSVPPSGQRAGRGVPVSRAFARARVRGRGRAYRGGAARARDCPRETAGAPRPSVPAGVFFAAPAIAFCRNAERRPPGEPPLSTFILHHPGESQASPGTKNENSGDFSSTAGSGATVGGRAMRSQGRRCMNPAWLVSGSSMTGRGRRDRRFAMQRASIPGR